MTVSAGDLFARGRAVIGLNQQDGRLDDNNFDNVVQIINAALAEFSVETDWDFLYNEYSLNTVADVEKYLLPSDHLRTSWVATDDTGRELQLRERRENVRYRGATGTPYFYSVLGDYLYLFPVPSQAETLRHAYYGQLSELPVTATTIALLDNVTYEIPTQYVRLLELFIAKHVALSLKDYDGYRLVNEEIAAARRKMADNFRRALGPMRVKTRDY